VAAPTAAAVQPPRPENFQVVYFIKPGCKECGAVSRKLEQLTEPFPHLRILEYDINKTAAVLLNEALSKRFGVPPSLRLVAPSVFSGGGYLIKDDITLDRLGQMLVRASTVPLTNWLVVPQEDLAVAHQDIVQRYRAANLGLILAAGLLDGINPCAFATIIFLLSYLQVSRKSAREILQIGLGYLGGVLVAYFLIGLGLAKVTAMVARLSWAGTLLTYAMAGFALVIMALNIRDGFLCRRGQMAETTLQLPGPIKNRIHSLIRHRVRQAHFVLVAFFLGAAISFLELACTGQVYLPTITYMIQQGEARAVSNLLAYNLAFIAPLATVFALSYSGLRSETLLRLFKRRAAWVKFGTALLFLALALFLVLGHQVFP
jgi:cytochrome c biogenesis protein CcdA